MMKKRLLMPLLVVGLMVASVAMLDSCKKNEKAEIQTTYRYIRDGEIPVVEEIINVKDGGLGFPCPYCGEMVYQNDTSHWHTFGEKLLNTGETIVGEYPVNWCSHGYLGGMGCEYSGDWLAMYPGVDSLQPRYHGHLIYYHSGDGINTWVNAWHVGGGVPGWPNP